MARIWRVIAGLTGGAIGGVVYFFVYTAILRWFYVRHREGAHSSEFYSLESFACYGLFGFLILIGAGAAVGIVLARRCTGR
jgi:hypothetical protein